MTRPRDQNGQYVETVAPQSVLEVLNRVNGPVITSSDVAEYLDCTTEAARQKLRRLVDCGALDRRKTGRTVLYWSPNPDGEELNPGNLQGNPDTTLAGESSHTDEAAVSHFNAPEHLDDDTPDTHPAESDLVADIRTCLKQRGIGPQTEHGRAAIGGVVQYLRDNGTATRTELTQHLYDQFGEHYSSEHSLWESIQPEFEDVPGITGDGSGRYTYPGDDAVRDEINVEEAGIYDPTAEFE